jgi:hypothetical protein
MSNPHPISRRNKPNKASTARIERTVQEGRRLPHEQLMRIGEDAMAMADRYRPGTKEKPNPEYDAGEFWHSLSVASDAFGKAAPYYAARLTAIAVQQVPGGDQGPRADPRQVMWEIYLEMRRRNEVGLKVIEPPKQEPVEIQADLHTPVVEPDDADGEAA